jgi:glycosyltransferase involved in cell wall biosynthesis
LNAVKDLDEDVAIVFVGGEPTQEYIDVKEKYNLRNVYFVGFKSKNELTEYYKAADLFILPTREDIWGLVINEAMACGLPVITTNKCIAGLELIDDNENGFIVPVDDSCALAEKINVINNDKNLRRTMTLNNLRKIKFYTIESMAITHLDIIEKIRKHYLK